ncbi:MAG: hypothetical protein JNL58_06730 [Planctomyces sp.]|nr:hypothetical protein [Planctomyces sp.]
MASRKVTRTLVMETKGIVENRNFRNRLLSIVLVLAGIGIYFGWNFYATQQEIDALVQQSIRFESRGRWNDLEAAARRWVQIQPESDDAYFFLGKAIARKGRLTPATAEESLKSLAFVAPESTRHQEVTELRIGILFGAANKPEEAAAEAVKALKLYPSSGPIRLMYCNFLLMTLNRQQLIDQVHEACRTKSDVPVIYGYLTVADTAFIKDRTAVLQTWYEANPQDLTLKDAVLLAGLLEARVKLVGNISNESQKTADEAMATVNARIAAPPLSSDVVRELLQARIDAGDISGVSELLQLPAEGADLDPYHWRARGWYRMMVEEYETAEKDLLQAKKLFPMSWKTHNELAALYRRTGRLPEAAKMQSIADQGRQLDGRIRELDKISDLDRSFLGLLLKYADECGDETVVEALEKRLDK